MFKSPQIKIIEKDLSHISPTQTQSTNESYNQYVVFSNWGQDYPVIIEDGNDFQNKFGILTPTDDMTKTIQYMMSLKEKILQVRPVSQTQSYANLSVNISTSGISTTSFSNLTNESSITTNSTTNFVIVQKYRSGFGNHIQIDIKPHKYLSDDYNTFLISVYVDDELKETWIVSEDEMKKDLTGKSMFIEEVLKQSKYIFAINNNQQNFSFKKQITQQIQKSIPQTSGTNYTTLNFDLGVSGLSLTSVDSLTMNGTDISSHIQSSQLDSSGNLVITLDTQQTPDSDGTFNVSVTLNGIGSIDDTDQSSIVLTKTLLSNGSDGDDLTIDDINKQLDFYMNDKIYNIKYFVTQGLNRLSGSIDGNQILSKIITIRDTRNDFVILQDTPENSSVDEVIQWVQTNVDNSGVVVQYPDVVMEHPITGLKKQFPQSQALQFVYSNVDEQYGTWFTVQGKQYGKLPVLDVVYYLTNAEQDQLDSGFINPIIKLSDGIYLWDGKTQTKFESKLSMQNVRRLVSNEIVKQMKILLSKFQFQPYSTSVINAMNIVIDNYFRQLQKKGQFDTFDGKGYKFEVITTPEMRNQNMVKIKQGIIPVGTIEYIEFEIDILPSGIKIQQK